MQFPTIFEFSEELLLFLADHVYSCLFGNFLGNCERERNDLGVKEKTISIWSYVMNSTNAARFRNSQYCLFEGPIWPKASPRCLHLWDRYFLRWDPVCHPNLTTGISWNDDWVRVG